MALKPTNASTAITTLLARYRSGLPTFTMVIIPSHLRLIFLNCMQRTEAMTDIRALTRHSQRSVSDGKEDAHETRWIAPNDAPNRHRRDQYLVIYRFASHSVITLLSSSVTLMVGSIFCGLDPGDERLPSGSCCSWFSIIPTSS